MTFSPKNYNYSSLKVYLYNESIESVGSFLYLGIFISNNDNEEIKNQYRNISIRSNILLRKFGKCNEETKIQLFKSYCQSIYGLGLWCNYSNNIFQRMKVCYNNAFRYLLCLNKFCSASQIFVTRNVESFFELIGQK